MIPVTTVAVVTICVQGLVHVPLKAYVTVGSLVVEGSIVTNLVAPGYTIQTALDMVLAF